MKKIIILTAAIAASVISYAAPINKAQHYDDSHFAEYQKVLDEKIDTTKLEFTFTEATDLNLIGRMFENNPNPYHRIDTARYKGFVNQEIKQCLSTTGMAVLFKTDSKVISVKAKWGYVYESVATMPIAYRGYDLYIKDARGNWKWAASGATKKPRSEENFILLSDMDGSEHECLLYLPNYCEMYSCKIGVVAGSNIEKIESPFRHKVVFHGSSYTHGISTSRSGMSYPMQFMRNTSIQVLSFGMSGNCKMQPYMAAVLEDVEADAYVFDAFSNPDYKMIKERLVPFIDRMVAAHPGKPLIFQQTIYREQRNFSRFNEAKEHAKQDMASTIFNDIIFKDKKYKDVYFIQTCPSENEYNEYSVDGVHPDDHGYYLWYKSIRKPLLKIFAKYGIR